MTRRGLVLGGGGVAGVACQTVYSNLLTGISSLPVRFEPVAAEVEVMVL